MEQAIVSNNMCSMSLKLNCNWNWDMQQEEGESPAGILHAELVVG